jgi:ADP-heptose:LPS heptosyltransferase
VAEYRRILLIRTDRLGDLVLSTPAIASFRRSFPAARLEALVGEYNEPLLRFNPDLDALHVLKRDMTKQDSRALLRRLGADLDLAVALAPRTPDYQLAWMTGAPRRLGYVYRRRYFSRLAARVMLTDHCISEADPDLADRFPDQPVAHEVDQVLMLVALAGGGRLSSELVLVIGAEASAFAQERVPAGAVGVNLAPRWFERDFGAEAMRDLIERLAVEQRGVLVTYGSDVKDTALRLRGAVRAPNVSWVGEEAALRWAAAIGRCSVLVTVDCGAVHVAAAQGVPVVGVYERQYFRLSSQEWSPWRVPSVILCKPPLGASPAPLIDDIVGGVRGLAAHAVSEPRPQPQALES